MPVQGRLGYIRQPDAEFGGREDAPAGDGVHDTYPNRVQQKVNQVHHITFPYLVPFPNMETLTAATKHGPAVVFLPGGGAVGRDYWNVHRRTAELTTSVIYDRAGTGGGAPAALP